MNSKKIAGLWLCIVMIFGFIVIIIEVPLPVSGATIYVDDDYISEDATHKKTIQAAIDAAQHGDTVYVYNGTYHENVVINKTINLTGINPNNTTIDGLGGKDVVNISVNWINITGFTITDGYGGMFAGVTLYKVQDCNVINNIVMDNVYGIFFHTSSDNIVTNNDFNSNSLDGMYLLNSPNNILANNNISSNNRDGISLQSMSNFNNMNNNNISNNDCGIYSHSSSYNTISSNNILSNNDDGINLVLADNNTIKDNSILSNYWYGLYFSSSSNSNNISGNNISDNGGGIYISSSHNNNISANNLSWNEIYGIYLSTSLYNFITRNYFIDDGIFIEGELSHFNTHTITDDNLINDEPLYYFKDCNGIIIDGIAIGQLILANCTNFQAKNLNINNIEVGLEVAYSTRVNLIRNNVSSNYRNAIWIYSTSNSSIIDNNASNAYFAGLYLLYSSNNKIINNTLSSNYYNGIDLHTSNNNTILLNNISLNWNGIRIEQSSLNKITGNRIKGNKYGIRLLNSFGYNNVSANHISLNTDYGLFISWSPNNMIIGNDIIINNCGINIQQSSNNKIYHNNIVANTLQAIDNTNNGNQWDNGYPSGGNYWSNFDNSSDGAYDDYQGSDQNILGDDGIVDNGTIGGGGKNPYVIDSDSQDNYPLIEPFVKYITLKQGWNLISLPLVQNNQDLTKVLEMIDGYYDAVQYYSITDMNDPWKHYKVGKPFGNDLFELNETMGIWIHITQPGTTIFLFNGTLLIVNQTIELHPGWNLVGYPSVSAQNRTDALNNIDFGSEIDAIWTYNTTTQTWKEITASDNFEVGKGYWIHSKVTKTWIVPL